MSTTTVTTTETTVLVELSSAGVQGASGIGYTGVTSNSTITLGTGLKTFTLVSGYAGAFVTGMRVRAIHSDTPTYYMEGTANYVGGGTIIVTVDKFNGTGSHNNWNFAVSGETGVTSVTATSPLTGGVITSTGSIGLNQALLSLTRSQISDFSGGTVASAGTAQQAGTAVYSTLSGTAVGLSGSITRSQVSDYVGGTVANISGTVAQSQVTNLVSDLSGKATLGSANTFTVGGQIVTSQSDTVMPLVLRRASATATASILEFQTSTGTAIASVDASGNGNFPKISAGSSTDLGYGQLSVLSSVSTNKGVVVRAASSQSVSIQEWQDSSGTAQAVITSAGGIATSQRLTTGSNTTSGLAHFTVLNPVATRVGVVVRGAASQSSNLQEWQDSGGGTATLVSNSGQIATTQRMTVGVASISAAGQLAVIGSNDRVQMAVVGNATQTTDLQQWQNSSGGTVAQISPFGVFTSGQNVINAVTSTIIPLIVKGNSAGTSDLQQWQNSFATPIGIFNRSGQLVAGGTAVNGNAMVNSAPYGSTQGGFNAKMFTDSTANAFQIQNSAGTIVGGRNAVAQAFTGSFQPILSPVGGTIQSIATGANPIVTMASAHGLGVGDLVTLASTTGGTYDGTFSISAITSTTFTIVSALTAGQAGIAGTASVPAQKSITARSAGTKGLVVRSASGQSANLQEWQTSAGGTAAMISNNGTLRLTNITDTTQTGSLFYFNAANIQIQTRSAANVGLMITGVASQSANLQEWQNSGGTALASINPAGGVFSPTFTTTNSYSVMGEANSGGSIRFERATATTAAPTNQVRIQVIAGLTGSKLVAVSPTGVVYTILDNIV